MKNVLFNIQEYRILQFKIRIYYNIIVKFQNNLMKNSLLRHNLVKL